jgi:hypothetical protein
LRESLRTARTCGVEPRTYLREANLRAARNPGTATLARNLKPLAIFILQSVFPLLDAHDTVTEAGAAIMFFRLFSAISLIITTYGFSMGSVLLFRSTLGEPAAS